MSSSSSDLTFWNPRYPSFLPVYAHAGVYRFVEAVDITVLPAGVQLIAIKHIVA
jgi:hypothetical protein